VSARALSLGNYVSADRQIIDVLCRAGGTLMRLWENGLDINGFGETS
jgi:hypothetical protein